MFATGAIPPPVGAGTFYGGGSRLRGKWRVLRESRDDTYHITTKNVCKMLLINILNKSYRHI